MRSSGRCGEERERRKGRLRLGSIRVTAISEEEQMLESLGQRVRIGKRGLDGAEGAGMSSKLRTGYYKT